MNNVEKNYLLYVVIAVISCALLYSFYEIKLLKDELQLRPPVLSMDITAIAMAGAKELNKSEERTEYVKNLEKVTHDLADKGYLILNSGNVLASPKENVITIDDIKKMSEK